MAERKSVFYKQGLRKGKGVPIIIVGMEAGTRTEGTVLVFAPFYKKIIKSI